MLTAAFLLINFALDVAVNFWFVLAAKSSSALFSYCILHLAICIVLAVLLTKRLPNTMESRSKLISLFFLLFFFCARHWFCRICQPNVLLATLPQ